MQLFVSIAEKSQNVKAGISETDLHFQSGVLFGYFRYLFFFFSHNSLPNSPKGLRQLIQIHEMHGNVENETKGEQTNIKLG